MQLQIKKNNSLQIFAAKHTQLQQLHHESAPKNGGAGPNSMVIKEYLKRYLKRYSTKSKFPGVG
jgi:hypothetical protein